jgi:hypothetical protein
VTAAQIAREGQLPGAVQRTMLDVGHVPPCWSRRSTSSARRESGAGVAH